MSASDATLTPPLSRELVLVLGGVAVLSFIVLVAGSGMRVWLDTVKGSRTEGAAGSAGVPAAGGRRWYYVALLCVLVGLVLAGWAVLYPMLRPQGLLSVPGCQPDAFPTGTCLPVADLSGVNVHWGYGLIGFGLVMVGTLSAALSSTVKHLDDADAQADTPAD